MKKFRIGDRVKHLGSYWTGVVVSYSDKYSIPVCHVKRDDGVRGGAIEDLWITWEENLELIERVDESMATFREIVEKWSKKKVIK